MIGNLFQEEMDSESVSLEKFKEKVSSIEQVDAEPKQVLKNVCNLIRKSSGRSKVVRIVFI